jgi:hypothetical protein
MLIEHLRKIDPLRDGPSRLKDEADTHNFQADQALQKKTSNTIKDITFDSFNEVAEIPTFGYTGPQAMWEK